jgi:general secretion pathway protein D
VRRIFPFIFLFILSSISCAPSDVQVSPSNYVVTQEAVEPIQEQRSGLVASFDSLRVSEKPQYICKVVTVKNISIERAIETLSRAVPDLIAVNNDDSNSIVLRGEKAAIEQAGSILVSIDKKIPQILIEGRVIEVAESGMADLGIVWGHSQGNFKFNIDTAGKPYMPENIQCALDLLIGKGEAKVLANPKISALDGNEAEINIGSRIPYAVPSGGTTGTTQWTVQYIDAGVNLKIKPQVSSDGTIVSTIKPEVSNVSEWRTTSAGEFPVISTRNASVTVRMKNGETLVIGGLINESERVNVSGLPILSDIPFVGTIFKRSVSEKARTEVIFLITPRLLD